MFNREYDYHVCGTQVKSGVPILLHPSLRVVRRETIFEWQHHAVLIRCVICFHHYDISISSSLYPAHNKIALKQRKILLRMQGYLTTVSFLYIDVRPITGSRTFARDEANMK